MNTEGDQSLGVEIGIMAIKICHVSQKGNFLYQRQLKSPQYLMPGAVTVELCEYFKSLNKTQKVKFIGIALPACIDGENKVVKESNLFCEWVDVPFADWLEIRLGTKVILGNTNECERLETGQNQHFCYSSSVSLAAMGAIRLAYEKLSSHGAPF